MIAVLQTNSHTT